MNSYLLQHHQEKEKPTHSIPFRVQSPESRLQTPVAEGRRARNPKPQGGISPRSGKAATMSALLRQGARRVGGSVLQRTQAAATSPAAAEERRRLVPRRLCSTEEREQIWREIQQKKEELYEVLAKAEQSYGTRTFQNLRLLQHLSVQVSPRPWNSEWRSLRFSRRINSSMEIAGVITLGGLVGYGLRQYNKCLAAREALWAAVMMEEEEQEARQVMMKN